MTADEIMRRIDADFLNADLATLLRVYAPRLPPAEIAEALRVAADRCLREATHA